MIETVSGILLWLQNISGIVAVCALGWHCGIGAVAFVDQRYDDLLKMDNAGWMGLAYVGLWMACKVGRMRI